MLRLVRGTPHDRLLSFETVRLGTQRIIRSSTSTSDQARASLLDLALLRAGLFKVNLFLVFVVLFVLLVRVNVRALDVTHEVVNRVGEDLGGDGFANLQNAIVSNGTRYATQLAYKLTLKGSDFCSKKLKKLPPSAGISSSTSSNTRG